MKKEFLVDLKDARNAAAVQDAIAATLPLPAEYGKNLDAFYDVLTEYGAEWRIVFRNARGIGTAFRSVCRDAMKATPGLQILFSSN